MLDNAFLLNPTAVGLAGLRGFARDGRLAQYGWSIQALANEFKVNWRTAKHHATSPTPLG